MKDTRNFIVLSAIAINFALTMTMVVPMLPLYASSLGATTFGVGLLVAATPLCAIFFEIPIGASASHIGLTRLMKWAFLTGAASGILFAIASTPLMLIVPQVIFGLTLGLFFPQLISYYYRISTPADRQAMQGYNTAFQGVGFMAGPFVAGVIGHYQGLQWVFIWYTILSLCGYLLCQHLRPLDRTEPTEVGPFYRVAHAAFRQALGLIRTEKGLRTSIVFVALMVTLWQGLGNTIFPLYIEDRYAQIAMMVGTLIAVREFGSIIFRVLFGRICSFISLPGVLTISIAIMAIGNLIIPLAHEPLAIAVACLVVGLGSGALAPGINLMALDAVSETQGSLGMAICSTFSRIGLLITAPLLGGMAETVGFGSTFTVTSLLCIAIVALFVLWDRFSWSPS